MPARRLAVASAAFEAGTQSRTLAHLAYSPFKPL
jgi:hypothetical protein